MLDTNQIQSSASIRGDFAASLDELIGECRKKEQRRDLADYHDPAKRAERNSRAARDWKKSSRVARLRRRRRRLCIPSYSGGWLFRD